jgi:hypothetical protein
MFLIRPLARFGGKFIYRFPFSVELLAKRKMENRENFQLCTNTSGPQRFRWKSRTNITKAHHLMAAAREEKESFITASTKYLFSDGAGDDRVCE